MQLGVLNIEIQAQFLRFRPLAYHYTFLPQMKSMILRLSFLFLVKMVICSIQPNMQCFYCNNFSIIPKTSKHNRYQRACEKGIHSPLRLKNWGIMEKRLFADGEIKYLAIFSMWLISKYLIKLEIITYIRHYP